MVVVWLVKNFTLYGEPEKSQHGPVRLPADGPPLDVKPRGPARRVPTGRAAPFSGTQPYKLYAFSFLSRSRRPCIAARRNHLRRAYTAAGRALSRATNSLTTLTT